MALLLSRLLQPVLTALTSAGLVRAAAFVHDRVSAPAADHGDAPAPSSAASPATAGRGSEGPTDARRARDLLVGMGLTAIALAAAPFLAARLSDAIARRIAERRA